MDTNLESYADLSLIENPQRRESLRNKQDVANAEVTRLAQKLITMSMMKLIK